MSVAYILGQGPMLLNEYYLLLQETVILPDREDKKNDKKGNHAAPYFFHDFHFISSFTTLDLVSFRCIMLSSFQPDEG